MPYYKILLPVMSGILYVKNECRNPSDLRMDSLYMKVRNLRFPLDAQKKRRTFVAIGGQVERKGKFGWKCLK